MTGKPASAFVDISIQILSLVKRSSFNKQHEIWEPRLSRGQPQKGLEKPRPKRHRMTAILGFQADILVSFFLWSFDDLPPKL